MTVLTISVSEVLLTVFERGLSESMLHRRRGAGQATSTSSKRMSLVCD